MIQTVQGIHTSVLHLPKLWRIRDGDIQDTISSLPCVKGPQMRKILSFSNYNTFFKTFSLLHARMSIVILFNILKAVFIRRLIPTS